MKRITFKKWSSLLCGAASLMTLSAYAGEGMSTLCGGAPEPCPEGPVVFLAKDPETCSIEIGGLIKGGYQYIDTNSELNSKNLQAEEFSNFNFKHIRLSVNAKLAEGWSGVLSVDFAGKCGQTYTRQTVDNEYFTLDSSCTCKDHQLIYVDEAYIQKRWLDMTFRAGYQKVNFGVEEMTNDAHLKTIDRSVATNFFTNLGLRAVGGDRPGYRWAGQRFGGRHLGLFGAGQIGAFNYSASVVNGYQGACCNSDDLNNSLGFFGSLSFEFGIDCIDFLMGVNAGFKPKGGNKDAIKNSNVFAFNPYIFVSYDRLSLVGEFFRGSVEDGKVTANQGDADPWGFNALGVYSLNDDFELVGRFSYVNSDEMGMSIHNSFGCAPENKFGEVDALFVASNNLFEKVYAGYVGLNYYMLNHALKASLGLEQAKFKNRADGGVVGTISFSSPANKGAKVNAVKASLQLMF